MKEVFQEQKQTVETAGRLPVLQDKLSRYTGGWVLLHAARQKPVPSPRQTVATPVDTVIPAKGVMSHLSKDVRARAAPRAGDDPHKEPGKTLPASSSTHHHGPTRELCGAVLETLALGNTSPG